MLRSITAVLAFALLMIVPFVSQAEETAAAPQAAGDAAGDAETDGKSVEAAAVPAPKASDEEEEAEAADKAKEEAKDEAAAETKDEAAAETKADPVAVETIEATVDRPAPEASSEAGEETVAEAEEKPTKAWSVSISHAFAFGLQADDVTGYSSGSLGAMGSYKILDKVSASASIGLRYTLDKTPNDAVRADLGGLSLGLNHASLYKDEAFTGLNISGGISFAQSLGMGTVKMGRGPTLGLRVGASRKVGPVALSYGLGLNRFFPVDTMPSSSDCAADRGSANYCIGGYANAWAITNSISANYAPIDELSLSASFAWNAARSFAPTKAGPFTSTLNPDPNNRRESFGFSLSGTWTTPIKGLSAGLSFSNARPWRTDGQTLAVVDFTHGVGMVFDSRYAALSVDVSYSF